MCNYNRAIQKFCDKEYNFYCNFLQKHREECHTNIHVKLPTMETAHSRGRCCHVNITAFLDVLLEQSLTLL